MFGFGGSRAILYSGMVLAGLIYLVQPMRLGMVRGESMEPTLHNGQPYLLNTRAFQKTPPQRGEVVVFRRNHLTYIKRVAAIAGDSLLLSRTIDANEEELVDQRLVTRMKRLVANPQLRGLVRLRTLRVPAGSVFVVGDATRNSVDSRVFGPIPISTILGQVAAPPAPSSRPVAINFHPATRL